MLCSSCTRWDCQPEDVFCGFCGHPAKRLEVSPQAVSFVGGARAKPARLALANRAGGPLVVRIGQPRTTREWLRIVHPEGERRRVGFTRMVASVEDGRMLPHPQCDAEVNIPPGGEYTMEIVVEGRLALPEKDLWGVILLAGDGLEDMRGNVVATRRVPVTWGVAPEPRMIVPAEQVLRLGGKSTVFDLRIANARRGFLTMAEPPRFSVPWLVASDFPAEPILPGADGVVSVASDPNWAPPGAHKVDVELRFFEVDKPVGATFTAQVRHPAQLLINRNQVTFPDLTRYSETAQQLVIENRGEEDLLLHGEPAIEPASMRRNVWIKDDDPSYRRIKSARDGHRGKVIAVVASGRDLPFGDHAATLRVASSDPSQDAGEVRLTLCVKQLARFDRLLALDFGTSNCCIAAAHNPGDYRVLDLSGGGPARQHEIPTVVYFKGPGEHVIGEEARNIERARPDRTVSSIKRRLGTSRGIKILGTRYAPGEIAQIIIRKLWERAAVALSAEPGELVVTVPCHFGRAAIDELLEACRQAGFAPRPEPQLVLDEPSAAAYRYLILNRAELIERGAQHRVLVFDFGGGTLDVALLSVKFGERPMTRIRVLEVDGIDLGGDDIDDALVEVYLDRMAADQAGHPGSKLARVDLDRIRHEIEGEADVDTLANRTLLRRTAEDVKKRLSFDEEVPFPPVTLRDRLGSPVYLEPSDRFLAVKRSELEETVRPRLAEGMDVIDKLLKRADVTADSVDVLLLIGGSSRMPLVRTIVGGHFPHAHVPSPEDVPPKQSVALGAVIHGYLNKFAASRFSRGEPEVEIEPMRERVFYSIGTLTPMGQFQEIVPRGGLPLFGDYTLPLPAAPTALHLVKNNGTTNQRFMDARQLVEIGEVRVDPGAFPGTPAGTPVTLNLFLDARGLVATIREKQLPVVLKEGSL
jgi:molecular chaperone DnaK (HSP70)